VAKIKSRQNFSKKIKEKWWSEKHSKERERKCVFDSTTGVRKSGKNIKKSLTMEE
jgi:hypothetical protein